MINKEKRLRAEQQIYMTQRLFLWSLGMGTALVLVFVATEWDGLFMFGIFYVIAAFLVNFIFFIINIVFICIQREKRLALLLNTLLLLLNIPVAILYIYIIFNH